MHLGLFNLKPEEPAVDLQKFEIFKNFQDRKPSRTLWVFTFSKRDLFELQSFKACPRHLSSFNRYQYHFADFLISSLRFKLDDFSKHFDEIMMKSSLPEILSESFLKIGKVSKMKTSF